MKSLPESTLLIHNNNHNNNNIEITKNKNNLSYEEILNKYNFFVNNLHFFNTRILPCTYQDTNYTYEGNNCLFWEDTKTKDGYGVYFYMHRIYTVHRLVYTMHYGLDPEGYDIDHLCNNRGCCNPLHLEAVTKAENCRRRWLRNPRKKKEKVTKEKKPQAKGYKQKHPKTHCKNGHEFAEENTSMVEVIDHGASRIKRRCKQCGRERAREIRENDLKEALLRGEARVDQRTVVTNKGRKFPKDYFKCGHEIIEGNIFSINDASREEGYKRSCLICHDLKLKPITERTACRAGHPYKDNLVLINLKSGAVKRDCKVCMKLRRERAKVKE